MNPNKTEDGPFSCRDLGLPHMIPPSQLSDDTPFSLPEFVHFRTSPSADSPGHSSDEYEDTAATSPGPIPNLPKKWNVSLGYISPEPHISSQFYTFNSDSHALMIRCILERRLATPSEIRAATPHTVLVSWRTVWKDRNEDTAYLTAWKRIQDKLTTRVDPASGNEFLCFKNNSQQFVSHINQWQDIVMSVHSDADLKHLGLKETLERIKQVWTVGAKFYGIPESYIRVCIAACPVCGADEGSGSRTKRRRFEYTESFDVPAKEVPQRLQQLAAKHKVVLCIRQKYIRYKPFMAEVKDYACHRAGEPASKKSRVLKREPYQSKRCGCGFRIRAIVPIANYSEKDKTFVYQEEGVAVFKLYAVHSGHEPGAMDGNARIMHRVIGHKGGLLIDQDAEYGVNEDLDNEEGGSVEKSDMGISCSVVQQIQDLRAELGSLEGRLGKIPQERLGSVSRELYVILNKVRSLGKESVKTTGLVSDQAHSDEMLVGDNDLAYWSDHQHDQLYGNGKEAELMEDEEDGFGRNLDDVIPWEQITPECRSPKNLLSEPCKPDRWLKCNHFEAKNILDCEDTKVIKPISHNEAIVTNVGLVGIHVDSFYQENSKWYDSPTGLVRLDSDTDCGDDGFRHGEIL